MSAYFKVAVAVSASRQLIESDKTGDGMLDLFTAGLELVSPEFKEKARQSRLTRYAEGSRCVFGLLWAIPFKYTDRLLPDIPLQTVWR